MDTKQTKGWSAFAPVPAVFDHKNRGAGLPLPPPVQPLARGYDDVTGMRNDTGLIPKQGVRQFFTDTTGNINLNKDISVAGKAFLIERHMTNPLDGNRYAIYFDDGNDPIYFDTRTLGSVSDQSSTISGDITTLVSQNPVLSADYQIPVGPGGFNLVTQTNKTFPRNHRIGMFIRGFAFGKVRIVRDIVAYTEQLCVTTFENDLQITWNREG